MEPSRIWKLIVRYLAGETSNFEARDLRSWAESDAEGRELLGEAEEIWDDAGLYGTGAADSPEGWDVEQGWARLEARRRKEHDASAEPAAPVLRLEPARRRRGRRAWQRPGLRAAAAIVLLLGGGVLGSKLLEELRLRTWEGQTFSTEAGQRATLRLGDGTVVSLGPVTQIVVSPAFGTGERREIEVSGIAFFEVRPNAKRPFVVHAAGTRTEVVGTAFGVRAHADDEVVEVVVTEGEVRFSGHEASADGVALTPGLRATYARATSTVVTDRVDPGSMLGWRAGELSFDDQPLTDVVRELGRWFALEVRIADADTGARRFSGAFRTESLREIVDILVVALDIRYTRQGDVVTFHAAPSGTDGARAPTP